VFVGFQMDRFHLVASDEKVGRLHPFAPQVLIVAGAKVTSIAMGWWYLAMKHDRRPYLANQMVESTRLQRHPGEIQQWAMRRGYEPSAALVFWARKMYRSICVDQLSQPGSPFKDAFEEELTKFDPEVKSFVACGRDYVWNTGLKKEPTGKVDLENKDTPGYGHWSEVLNSLAKLYVSDDHRVSTFSLRRIRRGKVKKLKRGVKGTVMVLSDSNSRQVSWIHSGYIKACSGAKFCDLAAIMETTEDPKLNVHKYRYLVIVCGANECKRKYAPWEREESWLAMKAFLKRVIAEGFNPKRILINLPPPHPELFGLDAFCDFVESDVLTLSGVKCINWAANPYSVFNDHDFYDHRYRDLDDFHINHAGFRVFWQHWCRRFKRMQCVGYGLSPYLYPGNIPFGEQPSSWHLSRKRRFDGHMVY
jgi:hypothetical protein